MKTGKNLEELAREIMRQRESARDFIAPTAKRQSNLFAPPRD